MIKILHCADMHLDSPFSAVADRDRRTALQNELIEDFIKTVEFCKENSVDILLIAGDLFDSTNPDSQCLERVTSALASFKGRVFISPGNHDPFIPGSVYDRETFPDNVFIFCNEQLSCEQVETKEGIVNIYGSAFLSYSRRTDPLENAVIQNGSRLNIICIHADLFTKDSSYAPISKASLSSLPCHYVALGHVHKRSGIEIAGNTAYSYCGSLCARDFGENNQKGCYLLYFDPKNPSTPVDSQFIPIGKRCYLEFSFDAYNNTPEKIIQHIEGFGISPSHHLRITLTGESKDMDCKEFVDRLNDGLKSRVAEITVTDCTLPPIDYAALENDPSVAGEFYRVLSPMLKNDPIAKRALRMGLAALKNKDPLKECADLLPTDN